MSTDTNTATAGKTATADQCPLGDAGITCRVRGEAAEIRKVAA